MIVQDALASKRGGKLDRAMFLDHAVDDDALDPLYEELLEKERKDPRTPDIWGERERHTLSFDVHPCLRRLQVREKPDFDEHCSYEDCEAEEPEIPYYAVENIGFHTSTGFIPIAETVMAKEPATLPGKQNLQLKIWVSKAPGILGNPPELETIPLEQYGTAVTVLDVVQGVSDLLKGRCPCGGGNPIFDFGVEGEVDLEAVVEGYEGKIVLSMQLYDPNLDLADF